MFSFLEAKQLVRVVTSVLELDELKITKGAQTSQDEWLAQGRSLFDKGAFSLAHTCFEWPLASARLEMHSTQVPTVVTLPPSGPSTPRRNCGTRGRSGTW